MAKVNFFDKRILKKFSDYTSTISTIFSLFLIFVDIPTENKLTLGIIFLIILFLLYFGIWFKSNILTRKLMMLSFLIIHLMDYILITI